MTLRPRILFYCQHSLGMGHLIRSLSLADAFAKQFQVVFLNGGPMPEGVKPSAGIEVINLPPLGFDMNMKLCSRDSQYTVEQAQSLRMEMLQSAFQSVKPHVVLIELFPFGRKKFSGELLPLLDAARAAGDPQPVIVCSLRDILVTRDQDHDERAAQRANRYFDAVLVHSDERFARLEESFHPRSALTVLVHYTGFVSRPQKQAPGMEPTREPRIVVSAGGGIVGEALLHAAIRAYELLNGPRKVEMKVIGGPFIPEDSWQALQKMAEGKPGLMLQRFVPDLETELRQAAASISQCGYNTAMEILRSRVPALVVPFSTDEENEQMNRARRLERLGALRVMDPVQLDPQVLAKEIDALLQFHPAQINLNLEGTENTAQILVRLVKERRGNSANSNSAKYAPDIPAWLEPASRALDDLERPANVFFRDDDGGWGDDRLLRLLDIFGEYGLPLDVAAIPAALTAPLVDELSRRMAGNQGTVRIHQHGYTHTNHEAEGKKCEFGAARDYAAQRSDIENGQRRLAELFGPLSDPIFTPPWNRCTDATVKSLAELRFAVLSRDSHATPFSHHGVFELPITLDWFANKKKVRFSLEEWGNLLAAQLKAGSFIGIMLHHAVMDETEMQALSKVLALLGRHKNVQCHSMRALTPLASTAMQ
jgi:predicted glycosyltransferase